MHSLSNVCICAKKANRRLEALSSNIGPESNKKLFKDSGIVFCIAISLNYFELTNCDS